MSFYQHYSNYRGIDKIPLTLATVRKLIIEQTGWNITILIGGPAPEAGGQIMTYL